MFPRGWLVTRLNPTHPSGSPVPVTPARSLLPAEMNKKAAEVLRILLDSVVFRFDLFLLKEPQHVLLELSGSLARDDLDQRRLLGLRLLDDGPQRPVDVLAPVVDVVQVKLELHGHRPEGTVQRGWRRRSPPGCWPASRSAPARPAGAAPGRRTGCRAVAQGRNDRAGRPAAGPAP